MEIQIRDALYSDCDELTQLAMRSKAHWGYDVDFISACRDELAVTMQRLASETTRLATDQGRIVGFYSLLFHPDNCELEAMFVEPEVIGSGIGARMWDDMIALVKEAGVTKLVCQSDPFAERFYRKMGMIKIGERASESIPDRKLPVLELSF